MKNIFQFLLTFFVFLLISCNADNNQPQLLKNRTNQFDSLFISAVQNQEIPGAVAYIAHNGQVVYHKAFGFRNMEADIEMESSDIFRMASMTKGLTAVAVLQLCEQELLLLDDKVKKYIPEFENPQLLVEVLPDSTYSAQPAKNDITIRQLLTHTSGIGYGFQDDNYNALIIKNNISEGFEDDDRSSLGNIQKIAKLPLLCEPGEEYIYSLSFDVLGVLIELVSGLRYDEYIKQNILDPLGMNDSYFIVPESERYRLVKAYQPKEIGEGLEITSYPDTAYPIIDTRQYFSGGADLCSTAEDYAKFVKMVLNKGTFNNNQILASNYIDTMLTKQTELGEGYSYQGLGTWITNEEGAKNGLFPMGTFDFGGFWDTYSWADPENNYVVVLLLQMYPCNEHKIHQKFQNIIYASAKEL